MKQKKIYALVLAVALVLATFAFAYVRPDQAPTKATISGPGLNGVVTITDKNVLDILKMGGLEDLTSVGIGAPNVSNGYTIQRWFDDGTFRFADLTYYPGNPSYVYFQDGPQLQGDHTPYNNRWLKTTEHGNAVLKEFLQNANASKNENIIMRANETMLGYDAATMQPRFVLLNGVMSADGTAYYAAFPSADVTAVHRFNLDDGSIAQTFSLQSAWDVRRVSVNGKWLVFAPAANFDTTGFKSSKSEIVIVNAESGQVTRRVTLDGNFEADGIDSFGRSLYLIQYLSDQYQVRLYDVVAGKLQDGALVDKREADEKMIGYPWDAVAAPQNDWLLTLYINTEKKNAFIHALNLRDQYTFCIDLPVGEPALLKHYVLALAPDEKTLYAIDPELGTLSLVDFQNGNVTRTIQFPIAVPVSNTTAAAVSRDGKFVYFTNGASVWQFDVSAGQVKQILQSEKRIVALNVRANDNALYLVYADHTMQKVNPQTASASGIEKCPVTIADARPFVPPAPLSKTPTQNYFWWGGEKLWTMLPENGTWSQLPHDASGYTQKLAWWRKDYDWLKEPEPALTVTGKRLDGNAPLLIASKATNGFEATHKSFMMVGLGIPTEGCWQITGKYGEEELRFVVWVQK